MPVKEVSPEAALLKQKFKITPKSATMLVRAGFANYQSLGTVSPKHVVHQFKEKLGMSHKDADGYRGPLRRIVWLGTQSKPEKYEKNCRDWSQKALKAQGVWSDDFDELTGEEMEKRFKAAQQRLKKAKTISTS